MKQREHNKKVLSIGDYDPLMHGENRDEMMVAVEHLEKSVEPDEMVLFFRKDDEVIRKNDSFRPFILSEASIAVGCPGVLRSEGLEGEGVINTRLVFAGWKDCLLARKWLSKATGFSPSALGSPFLHFNDPVQQYLMATGRTLFKGMEFGGLFRMQVDIECLTTEGYDFCNAEREGDRIVAIALSDQTGWTEVLSGIEIEEKEILERFVSIVHDRDPDVLEGHNIFNFDLPYIVKRARRHKVKLELGRDRSVPEMRPSRLSIGERTISYSRYSIYGRHIIDTMFLLQAYDVSHRSLDGFGLKNAAIHFGIAPKDRTYIEGSQISAEFHRDPERVMKYVLDDILETRALSDLLSVSSFFQAQILPYSYQNVSIRGNATKIDALMIREYLRRNTALPMPDKATGFSGGYTDLFEEGVIQNVHHCDIRSLYPSLMLTRKLGPSGDGLGVFLNLLERLKMFRVEAKEGMLSSTLQSEIDYFDALQGTFKILINSFYGYLGFARARFCDFEKAAKVTEDGRLLLKQMISLLEQRGAIPIEIDTDGIYFVPPENSPDTNLVFRKEFAASLPDGIDVEFDGEYDAMYSYKMKNYALLTRGGEIIIKGAALKSRGLELFQRIFLREMIRLKLHGKDADIHGLKEQYAREIKEQNWPIGQFAKTENLKDSPAKYSEKRAQGKGSRRAAYELALRSNREYRAGDQVVYYVTGQKKSVAVYESSKLISEWDSKNRDENVPYYLAKLEALYKKFAPDAQGELGL
ncbi:MAG: DNA polymerase II [Kiritimatiellae bacterium]|nr:DNA polymerase II [Kiritimatiellia bacterium]